MHSKEECLKALCRIQCGAKVNKDCKTCECFDDKINPWKCVENTKESILIREVIEEHFDKNGNVKVLANIIIDEDKMKEIIDEEIKKLIVHEPYKFEELKPNMWLWNDKRKRCFRLTDAFIRAGTKYYRWLDLSSGKLVRERFVEGQLYPPTKAMEYQEGN